MKNVLTVVLAVALLLDAALFMGIGFGLGALSVAQAPKLSDTCGPNGQYNNGLGGHTDQTGLAFCVLFSVPKGDAFVSNYAGGGLSTPITFSIYNTNGVYGSCSNEPWYAWYVGQGGGPHPAYTEIQILNPTTGQPYNLNSQSTDSFQTLGAVSQSGSAWWISYNHSVANSALCRDGYGIPNNQTIWSPTTFTVTGAFNDFSVVSVTFYTEGPFCSDPSFGGSTTATCDILGPNGQGGGAGDPTGGTWHAWTTNQAYLRLGGASASWNGQTLYNGQKFSVPVNANYDLGQGFHVDFLYPADRGGAIIATSTIPDDKVTDVAFQVPSDASVNSTDVAYNQFQVQVTSPITQFVYWNQPVDISPLYAPAPPTIYLTDLTSGNSSVGSGGVGVGDVLLLVADANGVPQQGEKIAAITLWLWYVEPGSISGGLPPVGSTAWISQGGQQGKPLVIVQTGYNASGSFKFTVGQPYSFQVQVESITNTAQTSRAATAFSVYVVPPGCMGPNCGKTPQSSVFWEDVGPALLSIALLLAAALLALWVPNPYFRYGIVVVGIAFVVVGYALGVYASWFAAGGILNSGGGAS